MRMKLKDFGKSTINSNSIRSSYLSSILLSHSSHKFSAKKLIGYSDMIYISSMTFMQTEKCT